MCIPASTSYMKERHLDPGLERNKKKILKNSDESHLKQLLPDRGELFAVPKGFSTKKKTTCASNECNKH